jgi:hypothetical protein
VCGNKEGYRQNLREPLGRRNNTISRKIFLITYEFQTRTPLRITLVCAKDEIWIVASTNMWSHTTSYTMIKKEAKIAPQLFCHAIGFLC